MDYEASTRNEVATAQMFESGRVQEAAAIYRSMASDPNMPFPDRVRHLKNLSHAYTRLGLLDAAEAAFDEGIAIEDRLLRGWMREEKAAWLVERGRMDEAVALYEGLLRQFWLSSYESQRVQHNLASLRS